VCLTTDGRVIRSSENVEADSTVKVRLHHGSLMAKVTAKE